MLATSLAFALACQSQRPELAPTGLPTVQRLAELSSAEVAALRPALGAAQLSAYAVDQYGLTAVPTSVAPEGDSPSGIAYTIDGARYLIAHRDSRNLMVFDASTDAFIQEVPLSGSPLDLAISPDGLWAATANGFEGTVSLIDLGSLSETAVVGVGPVPGSLAFSTDSTRIACVNAADDSLSVIDVGTVMVTQSVQLGGMVSSAALSGTSGGSEFTGPELLCVDGSTAVVPCYFDDYLAFVDLDSGSVHAVPTAAQPRGLAFTPQTGRLALTSNDLMEKAITVFDAPTQAVTHILPLPPLTNVKGPISIQPNGIHCAVGGYSSLFVMNLETGVMGSPISTGPIDELHTTSDGLFALGVGDDASLISYDTQVLVATLVEHALIAKGAVSPTQPEAVMTGSLSHEDVLRVETLHVASGLINRQTTGLAPEGDAPRRMAISDDGTLAVATNYLSDTASVVRLSTGELLGVVPVGDRPSGVAISPDASQAVVANGGSDFATVIDLHTLATTDVLISPWGSEVEISPDGQFAYVSVLAQGDGVWRIDLNTLQSSGGKLPTGDMSSLWSPYFKGSGIALSPDGSVLVTCDSYSSRITLIDTASWSILSSEPLSDLQISIRAAFAADTGRFVVGLTKPQGLRVYDLARGGAQIVGSVSLGFDPFALAVDPAGLFAYAGGSFPNNLLSVIDLTSFSSVAEIELPGRPIQIHYDPEDHALDVLCSDSLLEAGGSAVLSIDTSSQWIRVDADTHEIVGQTESGFAVSDFVAGGNRLAGTAIIGDQILYGPQGAALQADTLVISATGGGAQNLSLDLGPRLANKPYLILGTAHGTSPGLVVDGVPLPLTLDEYLLHTIAQANSGIYHNTLGLLDADGQATAFLRVPPQALVDFAGIQLNHAGVVLDPIHQAVIAASNPVLLAIEP